jgi:hypothetical protein
MRKAVVLALALMLASCAPAPQEPPGPDPRRFGELIPGTSTTADAVRVLGPWTGYGAMPQGQKLLQWLDSSHNPTVHIGIMFDASGRMIRVETMTIIP